MAPGRTRTPGQGTAAASGGAGHHARGAQQVRGGLLGCAVRAAGGVGFARGVGASGNARSSSPVLTGEARRFADEHGWFWPAVAAAAVVLALLGLAWLLMQFRSGRSRGIMLEPDAEGVRTRVKPSAITGAWEAEIGEYVGVRKVRARLISSSKGGELRLKIAYGPAAAPAEPRRRIQDEAIPRLCGALERNSIPPWCGCTLCPESSPRPSSDALAGSWSQGPPDVIRIPW